MSQQPRTSSAPSPAPEAAPPTAVLTQMVYGFWVSRCLQIMAELDIADIIGDDPKTVEELAQASKTHAPSLRRLLRLVSGLGILHRDDKTERFRLTEMGQLLRKENPDSVYGSLRAHGLLISWQAWGDLSTALKTGQPTIDKFMGMPFFDYLAKDREVAEIFNTSMAAYQSLNAPAVVGAYDFSGAKSVVDVGGGTGTLLARILQAYPSIKGAIYELPHVKHEATAMLKELGLGSRTEVLEGDFFQSVPPGYDIYILSQIIHDWDDERSLRILSNIRAAMKPDSKLLIVETVLPGDNIPHFGNLYDMAMLVVVGGRERTGPEYTALAEKAGLRVQRVLPTHMPPSVVEIVPI
ncbi:acetylserotonin O-methyltransferase [Myxococcus sp. K15C18031901]|uniref:acetylserotonin O-methyltransferase n=1 Tax=Myxococcus dinghuensis TaxID=2906761 RepID=UPI0020A7BBE3|nr:acetylserotonin O-methyltransferase [Myxococcus dinghuensis]MCP3099537.1 acetylserotonin O-methyltransferase [Myxococcus dinghuensis]